MKSLTTGTASGCIVWLIVICLTSSCLLPVAVSIGSFTSTSELAVRTTAPYICPPETTPRIGTYQTTMPNEEGVGLPATASVLECVDAQGKVVKEDPIAWTFIWLGICAAIGLVLVIVVSLFVSAPVGVFIGRRFGKNKTDPA
jgi:ABC-type glycerol-3-phosphate transport system permease component